MDFFLRKGIDFRENFDFKNENHKPIVVPVGEYRLILERGDFGREYKVGSGLTKTRNTIAWSIPGKESKDFEFSTLYYTLYMNDVEIVRGVLKVQ